jgi:hypothetical protein
MRLCDMKCGSGLIVGSTVVVTLKCRLQGTGLTYITFVHSAIVYFTYVVTDNNWLRCRFLVYSWCYAVRLIFGRKT